jgi:epoxyqueuosine reductase
MLAEDLVMSSEELGRRIVADARALGFHRVGLTPVEPAARHDLYRAWLDAGRHGEMGYLATPEHVAARADARALLAGARTLVAVALSYAHDAPGAPVVPAERLAGGPRGLVARYAQGADYHMVMKGKLARLAARIAEHAGRAVAVRPCVDTAPLLERDAAERAGLGFVGKNTMLIAPGLGSWILLGELLLDVDAAVPAAAAVGRADKHCGACRACLDACPTGAFSDAFVLDARRCISYLTIELVGPMPRELRPLVGTRIFGCDVCQEVCPWNGGSRSGEAPAAPELAPTAARRAPELVALLGLGSAQFRKLVRRSALRRVHREQLLRNVCVALGNAGDVAAVPALRGALADRHPLVRAHAAWALGRLGDHEGLTARRPVEPDAEVRAEIDAALAGLSAPRAS